MSKEVKEPLIQVAKYDNNGSEVIVYKRGKTIEVHYGGLVEFINIDLETSCSLNTK